jgi:poly-gamma-glutamate synthesis protein (capsule biosynthesis protein)
MGHNLFEKNRRKQTIKLGLMYFFAASFIAIIASGVTYIAIKGLPERSKSEEPVVEKKAEQQSLSICYEPDLQSDLKTRIEEWNFDEIENDVELTFTETVDEEVNCDIRIARNLIHDAGYSKAWSKVYLPVIRFDGLLTNLTTNNDEFDQLVSNQKMGDFSIIWDQSTDEFMSSKFGTTVGQEFTDHKQVDLAIKNDKNNIAIIPFEEIAPEYKSIPLDGNYPLRKDFNLYVYRLSDIVWIKGDNQIAVDSLISIIEETLGEENYDLSKLHDLILTGSSSVGAKGQFLAINREEDPIFPVRGVSEILKDADIAHISNESVFTEDCTQVIYSAYFCGNPDAMDMLKEAGIDIVGLSGNHIIDYGRPAFEETLKMYEKEEIKYFGGGVDYDTSHSPTIIEIGDFKIAFLGYNLIGPQPYFSKVNLSGNSGANLYPGDAQLIRENVAKAKAEADFVIVDMQWGRANTYDHDEIQEEYGRIAIEAGADIVNGVHPTYVQGIDYYKEGLIFYGLGSFLFDEGANEAARQGTMVRQIFYDGEYLGFELIPTYITQDSQTEIANTEMRQTILENIFDRSTLLVEITQNEE